MYKPLVSDEAVDDLIARKEFYQLRQAHRGQSADPVSADLNAQIDASIRSRFEPRTHQAIIGNMISPDTPYTRHHCNMQTGVGKTHAGIQSAMRFIPVFKKIYSIQATKVAGNKAGVLELDRSTPSVFIIGFAGTKAAFMRDLIFTPSYGFTTPTELEELNRRRKSISLGEEYLKSYKDYYNWIRKRVTNKSKGGFFKFYGYDEFALALFNSKEPLTTYEEETARRLRNGENTSLEAVFDEHIAAGDIRINDSLLNMFKDSLMICDEIHNTYNMNMRNNRGVAIQYVLDSMPTVRFLSLSATAINNSPTEVVEVVNYLVQPDKRLSKRDLFINNRTLQAGALERLAEATRGKVTFIQDSDVRDYPRHEIVGKSLTVAHTVDNALMSGSPVPYLAFVECPMSELHQATYMDMEARYAKGHLAAQVETQADSETQADNIEPSDEDQAGQGANMVAANTIDFAATAEEQITLTKVPSDGYTIYDMVFPDPTSGSTHGLYTSMQIRNAIGAASQADRDRVGLVQKRLPGGINVYTGPWLQELGKYSSKYATMLNLLGRIMSQGGPSRKIMIYHERVQSSGVLCIAQILIAAGFLDETSEPSDNTICSRCGRRRSEHVESENMNDPKNHKFNPSRFLVAHSMQDRGYIEQAMIKYNAVDNIHGDYFQIFLGSRIIKESYDFKCVRDLIILSLPTNMPTLLQVRGRVVRRGSHADLPPAERDVRIHILITTINTSLPHNDTISLELYRYIYKLMDYKTIQLIEREINRNCFDADIHRAINMSPDIRALYFGKDDLESSTPREILGNLYFDPVHKLPPVDEITTSTWHAYRYFEHEIHMCIYIIKRLFILDAAYTWPDLVAAVRSPPFYVGFDTTLCSEGSICIALTQLVSHDEEIIAAGAWTERLFDHTSKYVYTPHGRYKIEHVGKWYVRFPVEIIEPNPVGVVRAEKEFIRDKERAIIRQHVSDVVKINRDIESSTRIVERYVAIEVSIDSYIATQRANSMQHIKRKALFSDLKAGRRTIASIIYDFDSHFQVGLVEEAITKQSAPLWSQILDYYRQFDMLLCAGEVGKYKDMLRYFKSGLPADPDTIVGFVATRSCRLYDSAAGVWTDVSKLSLNRHTTLKENDLIVGQFETVDGVMKFKVRRPIHVIAAALRAGEGSTDTRLIERGIVCETKSKGELIAAAGMLGLKLTPGARIKDICMLVRDTLIASEIKARAERSRYAYLYSWWSEVPRVHI